MNSAVEITFAVLSREQATEDEKAVLELGGATPVNVKDGPSTTGAGGLGVHRKSYGIICSGPLSRIARSL